MPHAAYVCLFVLQFFDKQDTQYHYVGVDSWCDPTYNAKELINVTPMEPCLDMSIFYCVAQNRGLLPSVRAAIGVAAIMVFLVLIGALVYMLLAKASKVKRSLALSAVRLKGPPRHGKMTLVVTDIEGYSGECCGCQSLSTTARALMLAAWHRGGCWSQGQADLGCHSGFP